MQKRFLVLVAAALLFSFDFAGAQTRRQSSDDDSITPHYEIGGQIFSFHGRDLGFGWGAGGRFTYNLNDYVALDNEIDFFLPDEGPPYATQGLFGVKAGKHTKHIGIFIKARPGFQSNFLINGRAESRFAMDVGGVAEVYPNRHLVLRLDMGDVIIPFGNNVVGEGLFAQRLGTTHNFQYNLGIGIRF